MVSTPHIDLREDLGLEQPIKDIAYSGNKELIPDGYLVNCSPTVLLLDKHVKHIACVEVPSTLQVIDIFTKALSKDHFNTLQIKLEFCLRRPLA